MNHPVTYLLFAALISLTSNQHEPKKPAASSTSNYQELVELFSEWRTFEAPPLLNGAPDYTAQTFNRRWPTFPMKINIARTLSFINRSKKNTNHEIYYRIWVDPAINLPFWIQNFQKCRIQTECDGLSQESR